MSVWRSSCPPTLIEDVRRTEPSQRPGLPRPGNFVDSAHAWLVKQRTLPQYRYVLVPIPPVASRFGDPGRLQQGESVGSAAVIIHRPRRWLGSALWLSRAAS
jgi:hypothetical protein